MDDGQIEMMEHESADGLDGEHERRTDAAIEELRAQHAGFDRNRNLEPWVRSPPANGSRLDRRFRG